MIVGAPHSPAQARIAFARAFFEALAQEDFQAALGGLDMSSQRWSKQRLIAHINAVLGSERICFAAGFTQSASPEVARTESGYILRHRLPVRGRWAQAAAVFVFTQKPQTEYFRVSLRGFEP